MALPQDCGSTDPHPPLSSLSLDADLLCLLVVGGDSDLCRITCEEIILFVVLSKVMARREKEKNK